MRNQLRPWAAALAVFCAGILLGGVAEAQTGPRLQGYLLVQGKDLAARTVTLHGLEYQVTEHTSMANADGGPLTLEALRVPAPGVSILDPREVDGVYFEASKQRGRLVLDRLQVVSELPE